jgi:hypothetical protein
MRAARTPPPPPSPHLARPAAQSNAPLLGSSGAGQARRSGSTASGTRPSRCANTSSCGVRAAVRGWQVCVCVCECV